MNNGQKARIEKMMKVAAELANGKLYEELNRVASRNKDADQLVPATLNINVFELCSILISLGTVINGLTINQLVGPSGELVSDLYVKLKNELDKYPETFRNVEAVPGPTGSN